MGVKGLSPLHILPAFDVIQGVPIDYMHCLLEGIGKKLCTLWLTPSPSDYYVGKHIQLLDERLLSIKPPDAITRTPRSLTQRGKWKGYLPYTLRVLVYEQNSHALSTASEYRAWILFYALPVLQGVLPDSCLHHFTLLVSSSHLLLGENITAQQLALCDRMLEEFYQGFEALYGE